MSDPSKLYCFRRLNGGIVKHDDMLLLFTAREYAEQWKRNRLKSWLQKKVRIEEIGHRPLDRPCTATVVTGSSHGEFRYYTCVISPTIEIVRELAKAGESIDSPLAVGIIERLDQVEFAQHGEFHLSNRLIVEFARRSQLAREVAIEELIRNCNLAVGAAEINLPDFASWQVERLFPAIGFAMHVAHWHGERFADLEPFDEYRPIS